MEDKEKNELDLLDVLKSIVVAIKNGFLFLINGLGVWARLLYRHKILVAGCLLLMGLACTYLNRNKVYRAEADMKLISYSSLYVKSMLDPLHFQSSYGDSSSVCQKLGIPVHDAAKITDIRAYYYVDVQNDGTPDFIDYENKYDVKDTTMSILPWKIRVVVETVDTSLLSKLSDAFIYAITSNPQVTRENMLRLTQLDEKIAMVEQEMKLLDSLRKKEYFERKKDLSLSVDKTLMISEREMKLYHNDLLELEKVKQDLSWERNIYDVCATFENDFELNPMAINRMSKTLPKFLFLGLLLAICLSCLWEYKRNIIDYLNK